jgi:MFS transporter, MHS family, proline/betaine transporter
MTDRPLGGNMNTAHIRRVIASGMIGNMLEWYDFAIYGSFAAQIGRHFFPHEDAVAQAAGAAPVQGRGHCARQQDGPHRLGAAGQGTVWRYMG